MLSIGSCDRLQELETISERIHDIKPFESGQGLAVVDHHARLLESMSQTRQILDEQGRMRLSRRGEAGLDPRWI